MIIWADWHLGQFIDRAVKLEGSGLHFTITMHDYQIHVTTNSNFMTTFKSMGSGQKELVGLFASASLCVQTVLVPTDVRAAIFTLELKCGRRNVTVREGQDPGIPKGVYEYITPGLHLTNGRLVTTDGIRNNQNYSDYEFSNGDYTYRVTKVCSAGLDSPDWILAVIISDKVLYIPVIRVDASIASSS